MIWIFIIVFIVVATFAYSGLSAAPWVPTWNNDIKRFTKFLDSKEVERVCDLGCGDGRLVVAAARLGIEAVGYEISVLPYIVAKIRKLLAGKNIAATIHFKNFWRSNLSEFDVVYVFLTEKVYAKLKTKLEQELRPGSKVVVYVWPIPGWEPIAIDETPGQPKLFVYEI